MRRFASCALLSLVMLSVSIHAQSGKASTTKTLKGFGVTLILGDRRAGTSGDLPKTAAKALADLKDYLPYRQYRVLDTAWVTGPSTHLILRGVSDKTYELILQVASSSTSDSSKINTLRLAADPIDKAAFEERLAALEAYKHQLSELQRLEIHDAAIVATNGQIQEISKHLATPLLLIDTSLSIKLGETVVVGTSRVDGDQGLILLVTAVPE